MSEEGPFFCITLREGGKWAVEAEWPDGSIDLAAEFSDYFEATNWVTNKGAAWIEQRMPAMPEATGDL